MFWKSKRIIKLERDITELKFYLWCVLTRDKCGHKYMPYKMCDEYRCDAENRYYKIQKCERDKCPKTDRCLFE